MLHAFFHWYDGSVWGNEAANVLWLIPAYLWGRYHTKRIHARLDEQQTRSILMHKHIKELKKENA